MREKGLFRSVWDTSYGFTTPFKLYDVSKSSKVFVQKLRLQVKLPVHDGCVNTICWNENGEYILSGSDDQHLCVTHGYKHTVLASVQTGHRANIFSAKFLPSTCDEQVISCSGDGVIIHSNLTQPETSTSNMFNCHFGTAYEIMTIPNDPHTFLSCGEDGTVRWFDLRAKTSCSAEECKEDILINCRCAVTSLAVNPLAPYQLGVGCADASVRLFDCRVLGTRSSGNYLGSSIQAMISHFTVPEFQGLGHRITSLSYSPDGKEMLVSYSSDYIYLFEVNDNCKKEPKVLERFLPGKVAYKDDKDDKNKSASSRPRLKRLRVRGDWSDTGPNARPEIEIRGAEEDSSLLLKTPPSQTATSGETSHSPAVEAEQGQRHRVLRANLVKRMSDALKRMLNRSSQGQQRYGNLSASSSSVSASLSGSDVESSDDEIVEASSNIPHDVQESNDLCLRDVIDDTSENYFMHEPTIEESAREDTSEAGPSRMLDCKIDKPLLASGTEDSNIYDKCDKDEEMPQPRCVEFAEKVFTSTSHAESMIVEESDTDDQPGTEVLNLSLQSLEHELSTRRKDLIEKHKVEPVVSLHFSGQGMNSGLITVDVADTGQHQWQNQNLTSIQGDTSHGDQTQEEYRHTDENLKRNVNRSSPSDQISPGSSTSSSCDKHISGISCGTQNNVAFSFDSPLSATSEHKLECHHSYSDESENNIQQNQQDFCWFNESNEEQSLSQTEQLEQEEESHSERISRNESNLQEDSEPPVLMEMGNWNVDSSSDDEQVSHPHMTESSVHRRTSSGSIPDRILRSVDDDLKWRQEEREQEKAQLMKVPQPCVKRKFTGHRNARTMIKEATFWGNNFIMSGSDCGHIFIWDRFTSELVMIMEADHHVVNCLQPHPFDPILASSGIDYDIKLWAPLREEPFFDRKKAKEIMERNEIMLEETKDTITVPASFMIRMLASLNTLRSSGRRQRRMIYLDHEDD